MEKSHISDDEGKRYSFFSSLQQAFINCLLLLLEVKKEKDVNPGCLVVYEERLTVSPFP